MSAERLPSTSISTARSSSSVAAASMRWRPSSSRRSRRSRSSSPGWRDVVPCRPTARLSPARVPVGSLVQSIAAGPRRWRRLEAEDVPAIPTLSDSVRPAHGDRHGRRRPAARTARAGRGLAAEHERDRAGEVDRRRARTVAATVATVGGQLPGRGAAPGPPSAPPTARRTEQRPGRRPHALGPKGSTEPSQNSTAPAPAASAERSSVPALPGSPTPTSTSASGPPPAAARPACDPSMRAGPWRPPLGRHRVDEPGEAAGADHRPVRAPAAARVEGVRGRRARPPRRRPARRHRAPRPAAGPSITNAPAARRARGAREAPQAAMRGWRAPIELVRRSTAGASRPGRGGGGGVERLGRRDQRGEGGGSVTARSARTLRSTSTLGDPQARR